MAGIDVNINKLDTLYHTIWVFINLKKGEAEPTNYFKLHFDNFYGTMELAGGEIILQSDQITKNGSQA